MLSSCLPEAGNRRPDRAPDRLRLTFGGPPSRRGCRRPRARGEYGDAEGRLALRPGTLYGALDRLTDEGLVEPDREEVVGGRLRRYYRLTDAGSTVLAAETERLRRNVEAASRRLRARTAGAKASARPAPAIRLAGGPA